MTEQLTLRLYPKDMARIDRIAAATVRPGNAPNRAEAIRHILSVGLDQMEQQHGLGPLDDVPDATGPSGSDHPPKSGIHHLSDAPLPQPVQSQPEGPKGTRGKKGT